MRMGEATAQDPAHGTEAARLVKCSNDRGGRVMSGDVNLRVAMAYIGSFLITAALMVVMTTL